jgi:Fur family transcriptional regulator, ferric uptake regulator
MPTALQTGLHQTHRRLTRPRQVVLDVIQAAGQHLTPAEIYERARARYSHLGLATVYRSLDLLVQMGYIQRIHLEEGCHSYAPMDRPHGHHVVCSNCGRTEEFVDCDLEPLMKRLRARTGFEIDLHVLELMGRCPSCQGKHPERKRQSEKRNSNTPKKGASAS